MTLITPYRSQVASRFCRKEGNIMKDKMTVLCVKPGEKPKRIEIESGLDALQRAVGGYIEAVYPYEDPVALIVNA